MSSMDTTRPRTTLALPEGARPMTANRDPNERPTFSKPAYTKPAGGSFHPKPGGNHFKKSKKDTDDPDLIRDWPLVPEKGDKPEDRRYLSVRRDSVGWICGGKGDLKGRTIIGLRNAGAAAIPVDAAYDMVNAWWRAGYPLTVKRGA